MTVLVRQEAALSDNVNLVRYGPNTKLAHHRMNLFYEFNVSAKEEK